MYEELKMVVPATALVATPDVSKKDGRPTPVQTGYRVEEEELPQHPYWITFYVSDLIGGDVDEISAQFGLVTIAVAAPDEEVAVRQALGVVSTLVGKPVGRFSCKLIKARLVSVETATDIIKILSCA